MGRALQSRFLRLLLTIGLLTAVYFCAAHFSLKLAFLNASASPVWPPTGIAIAALLLFGYRTWPGIFIGAFIANQIAPGNTVTSLCIATGNTLEALCAVWLINRFADGPGVFDRAHDVFKFAVASLIGTVISATLGVSSLTLAGFATAEHFRSIWLTWWMGDFSGAIIFAPLITLWLSQPLHRHKPRHALEIGILLFLLIVMGEIVFGGLVAMSTLNYPSAFILGPIIVWTAFRLSQRETATGIFILSLIAIWGTLHRFGPFVRENPNDSLLILQSFNVLTTITAIALAAGMAERRRAREEIEEQKAVVEGANRTKDNFLAMLSHELRTPLTPVLAALETLEGDTDSPETKASLGMIRRNVELESQLIDDLLDLTRIAKDKLQLKFDPIDVHPAIENVVQMCANEADARKLHIHCNLRAGAHHVAADTAKFQQIIWNLLKNAIKFTGENGNITIATANPAPQILEITVRDTGVGIEPEIMERIFNPFEQGDRSFQRRFGGLGLGLAISKSLTEAHGGKLTARSQGRGQGSTFSLTMKTVAPRQPTARHAGAPLESPLRSLRILLVDDHQDTCAALEKLLVRRGHLVAAMPNMRSALEAAARNQFDLLISDIALPDGSGTELMTCLRGISGIRGIAISGFGMNGDIERSLRAGFSDHLVKPVKLERLEAAIERAIGG